MTIWLYWEDIGTTPRPAYLDVCSETVKKHCSSEFEIRTVSRQEARQLLDPPKIWEEFVYPAHRADFVRAGLLSKFGGIWLDSDLIILKSLAPIKRLVMRTGFVGYSPYKERAPEIGFLASNPGNEIITSWYNTMRKSIIEKNAKDFHWLEIGQAMLHPYTLTNTEWTDLHYSSFSPIRGKDKQLFFREDLKISDYTKDNTLGIMLFNQGFKDHPIKKMNREQVLDHPCILSQALRLGLGLPKKHELQNT